MLQPTFSLNRSRRFVLATAALWWLSACSPSDEGPRFLGNDISQSRLGENLSMIDTQGTLRSLHDFKGKVTVFFFGFTQCPDVCPTAMAQLVAALEELGPQADQVQIVLISVDPERDTPEQLAHYVHAFNPDFIGLTGTPEQLAATARSFKAYYAKVRTGQPGHYSVDHSAAFYLFDKNGRARVQLHPNSSPRDIAADLRSLINAG